MRSGHIVEVTLDDTVTNEEKAEAFNTICSLRDIFSPLSRPAASPNSCYFSVKENSPAIEEIKKVPRVKKVEFVILP